MPGMVVKQLALRKLQRKGEMQVYAQISILGGYLGRGTFAKIKW